MRTASRVFLLLPALLLTSRVGLLALAHVSPEQDVLRRREALWNALVVDHITAAHMVTPGGQFAGEWLMGSVAMAAYAELNLASRGLVTMETATAHVDAYLQRMLEAETRSFDTQRWGEDALLSLPSSRGHLGYLGHLGLMLGGRLLLPVPAPRELWRMHRDVMDALARRMDQAPTAQVETYPGETYPSDNAVLVAALAVDQRATGTDHAATLQRYARETATLLDPGTGLLVFNVHDGKRAGPARGSSVGWNIFFWNQGSQPLARQQYAAWTRTMRVEPIPGLVASREHPHGVDLDGDVDSGPLIFGLSPSGTGFAVAAAEVMGDTRTRDGLLRTAECAGITAPWPMQRRYLLAPLVGDAIVLAMRTAVLWDFGGAATQRMHVPPDFSRVPAHSLRKTAVLER